MKLWMMLSAQAQAGSLAADRLAIYHHAVQSMSEEARLGVLTAWQGSFTLKVVGLTPAAGEASREALAASGFEAHLGSGAAPYLDGDLQAKMYTITTRSGLPTPERPELDAVAQAFSARDIHLEHEFDGSELILRGVASSAAAGERLAVLLRSSPCFSTVESQPVEAVEEPSVALSFRLDASPGLVAGVTDCLADDAIPSTAQVEAWMSAATARGLTLQRAEPRGSGRSRLATLQATGAAEPLLEWMALIEAPDQETRWIWDQQDRHLRVEMALFSADPLDEEATRALTDARITHRRAQRRAPRGAPDPALVYQRAQEAAQLAELAADYALLEASHPLLLERDAAASPPPPFSARTSAEGRSAVQAQQAALQGAVAALGLDTPTSGIDTSLRVFSMFIEQNGGQVLPGQVVRERHEGLLRHQHVAVQVQGERAAMDALHATILRYTEDKAASVLLSEAAVSGEGDAAILALTVDLWGVDDLPERSAPERSAPPLTRAEMLAALGRAEESERDPFVDPPSFAAARAAAQEQPTCARHPLGVYAFIGHDGDRGQFQAEDERCEVAVGERLGKPLDGMDAWFVLVSVDEAAARFELRAADGGAAPIEAATTLERTP